MTLVNCLWLLLSAYRYVCVLIDESSMSFAASSVSACRLLSAVLLVMILRVRRINRNAIVHSAYIEGGLRVMCWM